MLEPQSDTLKTLTVNGYDVKIKKSQKSAVSSVESTPSQGMVQTNIPEAVEPKEVIVEKKVEVKTVNWWMVAAAFLGGMLFMYLLRFIPKRGSKPYKESDALKVLYAHMSEDAKVEEMVRKLYAKKNGDKSVQIDKKELKEMVERFR